MLQEGMDRFHRLFMLEKPAKWMAISAVMGIATYYCEWTELVRPGTCNQDLAFTIIRMYGVPLLLAAILGYKCPSKPLACWLMLMLPSWVVRAVPLASPAMSGSNLALPLFWVDVLHLLLTGLVAWGGAALATRIGRRP